MVAGFHFARQSTIVCGRHHHFCGAGKRPTNRLERKPLILFALSYLIGLGWKRLDTLEGYMAREGSLRVSQSRVLF